MKKKELLELIKDIEDDKDIDEIVEKSELATKFGGLDVFKEKINTDKDFKSWLDSEKDKYNAKALETWKANNLSNLIDEKVKELYPDEDPKDSELKKLRTEMETMKKETLKKELTNKALKRMTDQGLPTDLVDFIVGGDEDTTIKNIDLFKEKFTKKLETTVKERLKDNSYTPPSGGSPTGSNPYAKETFNLTKQMELEMNNPEQAKLLKEQIK